MRLTMVWYICASFRFLVWSSPCKYCPLPMRAPPLRQYVETVYTPTLSENCRMRNLDETVIPRPQVLTIPPAGQVAVPNFGDCGSGAEVQLLCLSLANQRNVGATPMSTFSAHLVTAKEHANDGSHGDLPQRSPKPSTSAFLWRHRPPSPPTTGSPELTWGLWQGRSL